MCYFSAMALATDDKYLLWVIAMPYGPNRAARHQRTVRQVGQLVHDPAGLSPEQQTNFEVVINLSGQSAPADLPFNVAWPRRPRDPISSLRGISDELGNRLGRNPATGAMSRMKLKLSLS
jgi:hypothetical protein